MSATATCWLGMAALLIPICICDVYARVIPDLLVALLFAAGVAGALWLPDWPLTPLDALAGGTGSYLLLVAADALHSRATGKRGCYPGDYKLAGALGAWTGLLGMSAALILCLPAGLVVWLVLRHRPTATALPYAPVLAPAALLVAAVQFGLYRIPGVFWL